MTKPPLILGFDTSAAHCAAALLSGETVLAARHAEGGRGQVERLMPLLEEILKDAGYAWADLSAIGVGVGPGNFTGIRISVSAARGLSLALNIPAIGVSTFEATQITAPVGTVPTVTAPRDQLYAQLDGQAGKLMQRSEAEALCQTLVAPPPPDTLATSIALVALAKHTMPAPRPAPLYIKAADAAPARDAAPVILSDDT
ncbi:MAG: tRNA (adenosine(37)-N6)-threonylcarbamoyltransferase complex dimerization subunit type 1 TsaB [Thalassovita sp.]